MQTILRGAPMPSKVLASNSTPIARGLGYRTLAAARAAVTAEECGRQRRRAESILARLAALADCRPDDLRGALRYLLAIEGEAVQHDR